MKNAFSLLLFLIIILTISSCKNEIQLQKIEANQHQIDSTISLNQELEKIIQPYRKSLDSEMNRTLSYTSKSMYKTDNPLNTAIGNMMADAVLEMANPIFASRYNDSIDGVLLNYGGIRSGINQGNISTRTAYDIMPFENMVVVAELDAKQMIAMTNYLAKNQKAHPIANIKLKLNSDNNVIGFSINAKPLNDNKIYLIATSDYLLAGGDNMDFFKESIKIYKTDYKLRNLFIDYFKKHDTINSSADDRFIKIQ